MLFLLSLLLNALSVLFLLPQKWTDNLPTACFCMVYKGKSSFYVLNGWEKFERKPNLWCMKKIIWNSIKGHKNTLSGVFLWWSSGLDAHTPSAGGLGWIPGQRTRSYMLQLRDAESLGKGEKESNSIFTEKKWRHAPQKLSVPTTLSPPAVVPALVEPLRWHQTPRV